VEDRVVSHTPAAGLNSPHSAVIAGFVTGSRPTWTDVPPHPGRPWIPHTALEAIRVWQTIMAGEQRLATQPLFQVMNRAKHVLPRFA
jgi:hypothetical protein